MQHLQNKHIVDVSEIQTGKGEKRWEPIYLLHMIFFFKRYLFYMLICSYFKVLLKIYVQNCSFSPKKKLHRCNILIKIEYICSKPHVVKDEVLCSLFKTILAD